MFNKDKLKSMCCYLVGIRKWVLKNNTKHDIFNLNSWKWTPFND